MAFHSPPPPPPPPRGTAPQQQQMQAQAYQQQLQQPPPPPPPPPPPRSSVDAAVASHQQQHQSQLQLTAQRALPEGFASTATANTSRSSTPGNNPAATVSVALPVWGPNVQLAQGSRGQRVVSAKNPFASMPRGLRNAQLRRNLCGVAEALKEQPLLAASLAGGPPQQQQQAAAPGAAFDADSGSSFSHEMMQAGGGDGSMAVGIPQPEAVTAGSSGGSLRRSWEASASADPNLLLSSSVSDNNSSGRLPVLGAPWGDSSNSGSFPLLQLDPSSLAHSGGRFASAPGAVGVGGAGGGVGIPSDLLRLGSITEGGGAGSQMVMRSDGSFTGSSGVAGLGGMALAPPPPPPPPPRQLSQQQQQQMQQRSSMDAGVGLMSPAAAARSSFDGLSLMQLEHLQQQQQMLQQQHQQQQLQRQQGMWPLDPTSCLMPGNTQQQQQQQQQVGVGSVPGSVIVGSWGSQYSSGTSRQYGSLRASTDSSRPSTDRPTSFDYSNHRLSIDSRGTATGYCDSSRGASLDIMSGGVGVSVGGGVAGASPPPPPPPPHASPATPSNVGAGGLMGRWQLQQQQQVQLQGQGQGQSAAQVAATVVALEQQIRQVEMAIAQQQLQEQGAQQQQLAAICEQRPLLVADPSSAVGQQQQEQSDQMGRRLSLSSAMVFGGTPAPASLQQRQPSLATNSESVMSTLTTNLSAAGGGVGGVGGVGGAPGGGRLSLETSPQSSFYASLGELSVVGGGGGFHSQNSSLDSALYAPQYHSKPLPGGGVRGGAGQQSEGELTLAHFLQQQQGMQGPTQQQGPQPQQLQQVMGRLSLSAAQGLGGSAGGGGGSMGACAAVSSAALSPLSVGGSSSAGGGGSGVLSPQLALHHQQQQLLLQHQQQQQLSPQGGVAGADSGADVSQHVQGLLRQHAALAVLQQELQQELHSELMRLVPSDH